MPKIQPNLPKPMDWKCTREVFSRRHQLGSELSILRQLAIRGCLQPRMPLLKVTSFPKDLMEHSRISSSPQGLKLKVVVWLIAHLENKVVRIRKTYFQKKPLREVWSTKTQCQIPKRSTRFRWPPLSIDSMVSSSLLQSKLVIWIATQFWRVNLCLSRQWVLQKETCRWAKLVPRAKKQQCHVRMSSTSRTFSVESAFQPALMI